MLKLIIGNQNYSTWSLRPWLWIHYHGIEVEVEKITLFSDQARHTLAGHFSDGKVPVLIHDDVEIWDTLAILEYLAEQFPHCHGWPSDSTARARARAVSAEMHSSFQALRNELPMNCRSFFPGYRLSEAAMANVRRIREIWNLCRSQHGKGGPWLFGEFTIADAMYAPVVMRFRSAEVELDPVSQAWCDTVNRCDAMRLWLEQALAETDVLEEDELDWPSEPVAGRADQLQ